ncbi:Uncharacterised protein [uncultured archaeon]|nr:Uncharacterised protein [uncultured archaeon]
MDGVEGGFDFSLLLNFGAILISLAAVIFWVKLYRRIYVKELKEARGWLWIFAAVFTILVLNISGAFLAIAGSGETIKLLGGDKIVKLDYRSLETYSTLGRAIVAVALMAGFYFLYAPSRGQGKSMRIRMSIVEGGKEEHVSSIALKYDLKTGASYLIREEKPVKGTLEYSMTEDEPHNSLLVFVDLVTHGVPGLGITRFHPKKIREKYGLRRTPFFWLSKIRSHDEAVIDPSDLVEVSHTVREFLSKTEGQSVVLLDGVEYLVVQNGFETVLKFIESVDEMIEEFGGRLLIPIDSEAFSKEQYHMLCREMSEVKIM